MNKLRIAAPLLLIMMLAGCQKETVAEKNLDDIYNEQGIPVKTRELVREDFSTFLSFTSSLKGIKESSESAMVADTVEAVLAEVGDYVEKDQVIVQVPKNNPSANYYQARAAYVSADKAFRRIESLYQSNGISRQEYDNAQTQYSVSKANWNNVQDMVEVKAPIAGYITRLTVIESDNINPGDVLFTVSNYDQLTAVVKVADHEIRHIEKGQRAYAKWEDVKLTGHVTRVDLSQDSETKAFAVQVQFDNSAHTIPSGVTADIDIETSLNPDSIVLHRREILEDKEGRFVYLDKDDKAVRSYVELGIRQGMYYQVKSGLNAGDKLITEGLTMVRNDSPIRNLGDSGRLVLSQD
jgi:RND family efflux transporter MFP subunit